MVSQEYKNFSRSLPEKAISAQEPIEKIRSHFETWMTSFPAAPEVRFEPFSIGEIPALWAFAPDVTRRRILLFFFGGGHCIGSIESHKNLIGRLSASCHAAVLAIQYRLAPEHPYPASLDDGLSAYRWLLHHPYARSRIIFSGISSGAGLALSLLLRIKQEMISMPAGAMCLCPWVDLQTKPASGNDLLNPQLCLCAAAKYANKTSLADPLISPIYGDLTGLPPLFLQTGTRDLLHNQIIQFAELAQQKEVSTTLDVWPDMIHAWQVFAPQFPECQQAIDRAGEFVNKHLAQ